MDDVKWREWNTVPQNADLIDRTALIASIDELHEHCGHCDGYGYISKDKAMQKVKAAPAVDAVKVVRCKDCKHWNKDALACDTLPWVGSSEHANWYETDFCSYGERRTDER